MADVAVRTGAGIVLMHTRGTPETMQSNTNYGDLLGEVGQELSAAVQNAFLMESNVSE